MRPGALIGLVLAVGCIIGGNLWEGGHIGALIGGPAFLIVIGGTVGAIVVQYPVSDIKMALGMSAALFKPHRLDGGKLVEEIVDYANRARRDGILALEKAAESASDPFLKKALTMAVDGAPQIEAHCPGEHPPKPGFRLGNRSFRAPIHR